MAVSIVNYELTDKTHNLYDVMFYEDKIHTLVTDSPLMVDSWISDIHRIHSQHLDGLIVGLDVEWRPNHEGYPVDNPVATLQLCVDRRCLIFQIIHAPSIPKSLIDFLGNVKYTFVGVEIDKDAAKLMKNYNLKVSNTADLRVLSEDKYPRQNLEPQRGIKVLTKLVLGKDIEKPRWISWSNWDDMPLTDDQVQYACLDAFVSSEIGRCLIDAPPPQNSFSAVKTCLLIAGVIGGMIISKK